MAGQLASWNDTPTTSAVLDFVERVTSDGADHVPVHDRVAVFDNDGTLWCEKPTQIQILFSLARLAEMAEGDEKLRDQQPWKAAYENDLGWLSAAVTKHYHGDDNDMLLLTEAIPKSFAELSVEEYSDRVLEFFEQEHPALHRPYKSCGYRPMVELLRFLEANGFTTYIASGGDRDFMRPVASTMYGIPPERVIGSSFALEYRETTDGTDVLYKGEIEYFDDGPTKPVRIWTRIGRRPIAAAGNANGDVPMLRFTGGASRPALRLLVLHDDADREFDYTAGAENALEQAKQRGWAVISIKNDWKHVYATAD